MKKFRFTKKIDVEIDSNIALLLPAVWSFFFSESAWSSLSCALRILHYYYFSPFFTYMRRIICNEFQFDETCCLYFRCCLRQRKGAAAVPREAELRETPVMHAISSISTGNGCRPLGYHWLHPCTTVCLLAWSIIDQPVLGERSERRLAQVFEPVGENFRGTPAFPHVPSMIFSAFHTNPAIGQLWSHGTN